MTPSWSANGLYLEACNCESICPCRSHDGAAGANATYDRCEFALSWKIENGHYGEIDLGGRSAVMTGWYADDEPGSPWRIRMFIDDGASNAAHQAIAQIFLGQVGGHPAATYAAVIGEVLAIEPAEISLTHSKQKWRIGVEGIIEVRASERAEANGPIVCAIPGAQPGTEYRAEQMRVTADPFEWDLAGRASFVAPFAYEGAL